MVLCSIIELDDRVANQGVTTRKPLDALVEGRFLEKKGGEGGIRTPEGLASLLVFETSTIDHSVTSPTPIQADTPASDKGCPAEFAQFSLRAVFDLRRRCLCRPTKIRSLKAELQRLPLIVPTQPIQ